MTKRSTFEVPSRWLLALTVLVASACDRHITVYVDAPPEPASGTGGSSASGGSGGTSGSVGTAGVGGASTGHDGGGVDVAVDSGDAGAACAVDADCPRPNRTCGLSRCNAGRCETVNAPAGATVPNVPADCHASLCDGSGHATSVAVAQNNVPQSGPCNVTACDASGSVRTTPLAAGTACSAGPRTAMCDGAGTCVECLHSTDCPQGLFCDARHSCGSVQCTDLDCGGACAPCDLGKHCLVDSDCRSFACDAATTTCVQDQCSDDRQDGNETDADCGGGACAPCELGQSCVLDEDCKSQACDAPTLTCASNQCSDHRVDGQESDVDCGGPACGSCAVGKACHTSLDCASGHVCGSAKVCQ
jgi:hypothetical protein